MHFTTKVAAAVAVASSLPSAFGHYIIDRLILNGAQTGQWEYVRQLASSQSNSPIFDVTSNDIRCMPGGLTSGPNTKVAPVGAGNSVVFTVNFEPYYQAVNSYTLPGLAVYGGATGTGNAAPGSGAVPVPGNSNGGNSGSNDSAASISATCVPNTLATSAVRTTVSIPIKAVASSIAVAAPAPSTSSKNYWIRRRRDLKQGPLA